MGQATVFLLGSLSVALAGAALLVGWKLGRSNLASRISKSQALVPPLCFNDSTVELQELLAQWNDIRPRLAELAALVRELKEFPKEALEEWRGDLVCVTKELRHALKVKLLTANGATQPLGNGAHDSQFRVAQEQKKMLTNEQIDNLLNNEALRLRSNGKPEAASRFKFAAKQPLAPIPNDGSPPETLCEVQCHDVSVRDVRFFSDDRPITDKVIIGLGVPSPKRWMVAEVEDSRAAFMYGKSGFLVTARFVASVPSDRLANEAGDASTETADAAAVTAK